MEELEQAAHDLVAHPARQPAPLAEIEARAAAIRRRRSANRVLAAAAVVVVVLGAGGVMARGRGDVDLQLGSVRPDVEARHLRITWDGGDEDTITRVSALAAARFEALGGGTAQLEPAPDRRSIELTVTALAVDDVRLLLETPGVLTDAKLSATSGLDPCDPARNLNLRAGWPIAEPLRPGQCYTAIAEERDLSGYGPVGQPVGRNVVDVSVVPADTSFTVVVEVDARVPAPVPPGTAWNESCWLDPPFCRSLFLDGVLLRDPYGYGQDQPPMEGAGSTWTLRNFGPRDARILAAILRAGPPLEVTVHVEEVGGSSPAPGTSAPRTTGPTVTGPSSTDGDQPSPTGPPPTTSPSGPGASLSFFADGTPAELDVWFAALADRFGRVGLHARFERGAPSGSWHAVTLTVPEATDPRSLEAVFQVLKGRGVASFAPVESHHPISSHYPTNCVIAAWGGECYLLGTEIALDAGLRATPLAIPGVEQGLDVYVRTPGALDGMIADCRRSAPNCPGGDVAFQIDGHVLGTVASGRIEPETGPVHLLHVEPGRPLAPGALDQYLALVLSGPLPRDIDVRFELPSDHTVSTTMPPDAPTVVPGDPTTTAPGPGATQDTCQPVADDGSGTPTTLGPDC